MATLTERTTVYLNPYVKKYLQHEAIEQNKSISELINDQPSAAKELRKLPVSTRNQIVGAMSHL